MLCTFCGTDNRLDNKFCGMCGVRLERRKVERRAYKSSSSLNCHACGHVNEAGHRFCGMCGAVVERRSQERRAEAAEQPRAAAMANAQLPTPEIPIAATPEQKPSAMAASAIATESAVIATEPAVEIPSPRPATPVFRSAPARIPGIGGPSFLGLNDDPEHSAEYLLDDDQASGGVIRKLVMFTILAVIAGLGFMYWRSSLHADPKARDAVKTQAAAAPAQSQNPGSDASDSASAPSAQPAGSSSSGSNAAPDSTPVPAATNDAAAKSPATIPADAGKPPLSTEEAAAIIESAKDKTVSALQKPKVAPDAQAKPSAALLKAQQYLQGRGGVEPNCEQGLTYLRAAAQKNEPAAAIQMSTLYATGHCVQQDRVMAYRWLNSAHELAPGNSAIQTNMDVLWGQMTSQERRQAGR